MKIYQFERGDALSDELIRILQMMATQRSLPPRYVRRLKGKTSVKILHTKSQGSDRAGRGGDFIGRSVLL